MDLSDFYRIIGELYTNIKIVNENAAKEINAVKAELATKDEEIEKLKGEIALLTNKVKVAGESDGSVAT